MSSLNRTICIANDQTLVDLIRSARKRIAAMAPAFSQTVAEAIRDQWLTLGADAVSVVVDVDPEVYRLGYGDFAALELLERTAADLGTTLNRHNGIRVGILVADETTLIYSPTPQLIEAGPREATTPNAVCLNTVPDEVARELGLGPCGVREQTVGLDKAEKSTIDRVKNDLEANPPQRFDVARIVRVFNSYFEFVEFELQGVQIQRHRARIPSELMGLANDPKTQAKLLASFKLVDESSEISGKRIEEFKNRLVKNYLTLLPGYGHVVLREVKPEFERKVRHLRRIVECFKKQLEKNLQKTLDESRAALCKALLPGVRNAPPKRWRKYGTPPFSEELARRLLDEDLKKAFPPAESLIDGMKVKLVFKGVTYESLHDEEFVKLAKKHLPGLPELHDEFDAAQAADEPQATLFRD